MERALVHWLKERGILSARRSHQYSGNSQFGDADIIADELPCFHIESKGTKNSKLPKAILKKWWKQIHTDVSVGKLPVIFHIANGKYPVTFVPKEIAIRMRLSPIAIRYVKGDSVTPSEHSSTPIILDNLFSSGIKPDASLSFISAFQLAENAVFYIINADSFLEQMKLWVIKNVQ